MRITLTTDQLKAAFLLWDKNHRENPHQFLHYTQVMQMSPEEAAGKATDYLLGLLAETVREEPPEENALCTCGCPWYIHPEGKCPDGQGTYRRSVRNNLGR